MNVEWNIPMFLTSPYGDLPFNTEPEGVSGVTLVLDPTKCGTSAGIRLTRDPISQGDGSILHREFTEGYTVKLGGWLMLAEDTPACGADLRRVWEELQRHLHALLGNDVDLDGDNSRLTWTPTDYGQDRILGELRLLEEAVPAFEDGITTFAFALHSRFPFAFDITEHTVTLPVNGSPATISNGGNVPAYPNLRVFGPIAGSFAVFNLTTGKQIAYDTALPGAATIVGGDYAFVNTHDASVYLNGNSDNLKAGIDVLNTDFFTLEPGNNELAITGDIVDDDYPTADVIWNDPWY